MNNLKVGTKFAILVTMMLVIMLGIGIVSLMNLQKNHELQDINLEQAETYSQAINTARNAQVQFKIQVQDWKNILLRGSDPVLFEKHKEDFSNQEAKVQQELSNLKSLMQKLSLDTSQLDQTAALHKELGSQYREALASYDPANPQAHQLVDGKVKGIDKAPTEAIDSLVASIESDLTKYMTKAMEEADTTDKAIRGSFIIILAVAVLLAVVLATIFTRQIIRPIHQLKNELARLAENGGDLTQQIVIKNKDEIGDLAQAVNLFLANLREIMEEIRQNSTLVVDTAQQLHNSSQQVGAGATETAATMSQIAASVNQVSESMNEISKSSDITTGYAAEGNAGLGKVMGQMHNIDQSTQNAAAVILLLSEKSKDITQIVELISTIAGQTNLLALNAAIEAARAGDQGRGFAVVAEEVRKLAEQSAESAQKIKGLIADIQSETMKAVESMEDGRQEVESGKQIVQAVGESFREITRAIQNLTLQIHDVVSAGEQMSAGVQNVAATTEEQTASVEEISASIETLAEMAAKTNGLIGKFKV